MTVTRITEATHTILLLEGRLDATTAATLEEEFARSYSEGTRQFIWDCAGIEYISSAGLRTFLQALKMIQAGNGTLVIAAAPPLVLEVFDISGFKSLLTLVPDRASAVAKLR